jgi:flagellar assembly factor FliW
MQIRTTRFGLLEVDPSDVIRFPSGVLGLDDCKQWVILADAFNTALGWLQCVTRPEIALAVVSPRRFVPDYQFRVYRSELQALRIERIEDAQVLVIVGKSDNGVTLNLKAPVVINLSERLARQVIANGDLPLQHELGHQPALLKKSA